MNCHETMHQLDIYPGDKYCRAGDSFYVEGVTDRAVRLTPIVPLFSESAPLDVNHAELKTDFRLTQKNPNARISRGAATLRGG